MEISSVAIFEINRFHFAAQFHVKCVFLKQSKEFIPMRITEGKHYNTLPVVRFILSHRTRDTTAPAIISKNLKIKILKRKKRSSFLTLLYLSFVVICYFQLIFDTISFVVFLGLV